MFEIYTPKAWLAIFGGSESLRINDEGYIYTFQEATRIFGGSPCGKIEWSQGKIYGKDFANFSRAPIGYMKTDSDGVIEIYNDVPGFFQEPVLYIKANSDNVGEIYTPENFFGVVRGNPSGYIKPMPVVGKSSTPPSPPPSDPPDVKGSITSLIPAGAWVVIGIALFLLIGNKFDEFWEDVTKPLFLVTWLGSFALIVFIKKRREKKKKQQQNGGAVKIQRTTPPSQDSVQPTSYTHYCTQCGKQYTSKAKNPRILLCDACKKSSAETPEPPTPTPEPVTPPNGKYTYYCTKCGKPYYSTEKNPVVAICAACKKQDVSKKKTLTYSIQCTKCGKMYASEDQYPSVQVCSTCKENAKKTPTPKPVEPPKPVKPPKTQVSVDGEAKFVSVAGEKTVLACPFCQTKLAIPNGKGNVVIKCASCGKKLSAKS